jgi:hypothetical protein
VPCVPLTLHRLRRKIIGRGLALGLADFYLPGNVRRKADEVFENTLKSLK